MIRRTLREAIIIIEILPVANLPGMKSCVIIYCENVEIIAVGDN